MRIKYDSELGDVVPIELHHQPDDCVIKVAENGEIKFIARNDDDKSRVVITFDAKEQQGLVEAIAYASFRRAGQSKVPAKD